MQIDYDKLEKKWNAIASDVLLNQKIVEVSYMSQDEKDEMYWWSRPVMFKLENGVWCYPSKDDEGNDGGALFITNSLGCLPVL
mgnify:CR=1 FL=1|tara:strand:- start:8866 stop:9114 length:249 start_codon:yes stop_codon:yes gene_type:complete